MEAISQVRGGRISFVLITLVIVINQCKGQLDNDCYCLTEKFKALENVVHIEPVTLDGNAAYLVAEQYGMIHIYKPAITGSHMIPYLDLTGQVVVESKQYEERGLLSIAAHPTFSENKKLFLYSTRMFGGKDYIVISEIVDADVENEKILLWVEQPGDKRNGGQVIFGADGYLYICIGDGGPADDQKNDAQNVTSLLGKILRIDVDRSTIKDNRIQHYVVPADNPRSPGWKEEIYSLGIRNTWRCDRDAGDADGKGKGRIFCGDLGSSTADEINLIEKGGNYGWNYKEGLHCFNDTLCSKIVNETFPIQAFNRSTSAIKAVVGGPLYRGTLFPGRYGQLIYGDFITGSVYSLKEPSGSSTTPWTSANFTVCDQSKCDCNQRAKPLTHLLSFGETHDGEVYMMMTDDLSPTAEKCSVFLMSPPTSKPVTCGATMSTATPFLLTLSLLCISYIHFWESTV